MNTLKEWLGRLGNNPEEVINNLSQNEIKDLYYTINEWEIENTPDAVERDEIDVLLQSRMLREGWDQTRYGEITPPVFDGECNSCDATFDLKEIDPQKMTCPKCGSRDWVNNG